MKPKQTKQVTVNETTIITRPNGVKVINRRKIICTTYGCVRLFPDEEYDNK